MKNKKYLIALLVIYLLFSLNNARLSYKAEPYYYGRVSGIIELFIGIVMPLFALFAGYSLYRWIIKNIKKNKDEVKTLN